jgi:putative hydrolase of the HAD superfamily
MIAARTEQRKLIGKLLYPLEPVPTGLTVNQAVVYPKAVIFDIYGTLLISAAGDVGPDSAEDNEQAFIQALADGGCDSAVVKGSGIRILQDEITKVHQKKKAQGVEFPEIDILQIWQKVLLRLGLAVKDGATVELVALSYECRTNPVWSMPGLTDTLAGLQSRGIRLGILSNAQFYTPLLFEILCDRTLDALGFDPVLSLFSYREGEGKPAPNLFSKLAARLDKYDIPASEVLYVGNDMLKDIWPAAEVGWKTALFAGDKRSLRFREDDPRVMGVQPDMIIDDLRQLLA